MTLSRATKPAPEENQVSRTEQLLKKQKSLLENANKLTIPIADINVGILSAQINFLFSGLLKAELKNEAEYFTGEIFEKRFQQKIQPIIDDRKILSEMKFEDLLYEINTMPKLIKNTSLDEDVVFNGIQAKLQKLEEELKPFNELVSRLEPQLKDAEKIKHEFVEDIKKSRSEIEKLNETLSKTENEIKNIEARKFNIRDNQDKDAEQELLATSVKDTRELIKELEEKDQHISETYGISMQLKPLHARITVLEKSLQKAEQVAAERLTAEENARLVKEKQQLEQKLEQKKAAQLIPKAEVLIIKPEKKEDSNPTVKRYLKATQGYKIHLEEEIKGIINPIFTMKKKPAWFVQVTRLSHESQQILDMFAEQDRSNGKHQQRENFLDALPVALKVALQKYHAMCKIENTLLSNETTAQEKVNGVHLVLKENKKLLNKHRDAGFKRFIRQCSVKAGYTLGVLSFGLFAIPTYYANRTLGRKYVNEIHKDKTDDVKPEISSKRRWFS